MGEVKRYILYAALYVASGAVVLYTHYIQTSKYSADAIDQELTLIAASHFNLAQLVDNLPQVFNANLHAAALKLSDTRGNFLGAMYDSRRMGANDYKAFLDEKKFSEGTAFREYKTHIWESKRRKLVIVAVSLERARFAEYLALMGRDHALYYIAPLYIIVGMLAFFVFILFKTGKGAKSKRAADIPQFTLTRSSETKASTKPKPQAWLLKPGSVADSTIRHTLETLAQLTNAQSVALFARKVGRNNNVWQGVCELRGTIFVRGLTPEASDFSDAGADSVHLVSQGGLSQYFFDAELGEATQCFRLEWDNPPEILQETQNRILDFVREKSRSLLVEHYYEKSIIDEETGLYSHPYGMFCIKERLLSGKLFATGALRLTALKEKSMSARQARTSIRVMREHFAADEAPVIVRGDDSLLIIIFSGDSNDAKIVQHAMASLYAAFEAQGLHPIAALVEDSSQCGSVQKLAKTLERLLDTSHSTHKMEVYRVQDKIRMY